MPSAHRARIAKLFKFNLTTAASLVVLALTANAVHAQDAAVAATASTPPATSDDNTVVVIKGVRASAIKSIAIKRKSTQVVDSVVADDIGKLPDASVVEALQRVPGVQVTDRAGGEVGTISIRGMSDISSSWNGRTIFTASGRYEALQDIPSTLVREIDVYKTRDSSQNEAGIAGAIDVKSLRPFDFKGPEVSIAARGTYLDPAKKWNPQVSALVSDRWSTGAGEFGALANVSYNKTNYRTESVTPGALVPFSSADPTQDMAGFTPLQRIFSGWTPGLLQGLPEAAGSKLDFGTGTAVPYYLSRDAVFEDDVLGERTRSAANVALQWKPDDTSVYTFEAMYNGYRLKSFSNLLFSYVDWWGNLGANPASTITTFPGTNIIKTRTVGSVYGFDSGDYTTAQTDSYVYALNGDWQIGDKLHLNADLSYQDSTYNTQFTAMRVERTANQINVDFNCHDDEMCFSFDDNSLLDKPSSWNLAQFYDNGSHTGGDAGTFNLNGVYDAEWGPVKTISFGLKYDDRRAETGEYDQNGYLGKPMTGYDSGLQFTTKDFWAGQSAVPSSWESPNEYWIRNHLSEVRGWYGLGTPTMHKDFSIQEETGSAYVMADTENTLFDRKLKGNFGLRYVSVGDETVAYSWDTTKLAYSGTTTGASRVSKLLPSLTLHYDLSDQLVARFNYGETLRRPDFTALNPVRQLNDDVSGVGYGSGSAGNPNLKATHSQNIDFTVEWYFRKDSALYATLFNRKIDGLVVTINQKVHVPLSEDPYYASTTGKSHANGYDYVISEPVNASNGKLQGAEVGFTFFPKGMFPGVLDGLGFQGSFTTLTSSQNVPQADAAGNIYEELKSAFYGVSRYSYNATAAYDKGPFNARLSYVWRSSFLDRNEAAEFANPIGIYRHPENDLDLQLTYNFNDRMSFDVSAVNLTNSKQQEYYHYGNAGSATVSNFGTVLVDRSVSFGFRWKM
jgi:TonB-dependent receptor